MIRRIRVDILVNVDIGLIYSTHDERLVSAGSVKLDHGGKAALDLNIDEKDVVLIKKAATRKRITKAVAAVLASAVSFVLGFLLGAEQRKDDTGSYPLAVAMIASAPIAARSSANLVLDPRARKARVTLVGIFVVSALTFLLGWILGLADAFEMESTTQYGVFKTGHGH